MLKLGRWATTLTYVGSSSEFRKLMPIGKLEVQLTCFLLSRSAARYRAYTAPNDDGRTTGRMSRWPTLRGGELAGTTKRRTKGAGCSRRGLELFHGSASSSVPVISVVERERCYIEHCHGRGLLLRNKSTFSKAALGLDRIQPLVPMWR